MSIGFCSFDQWVKQFTQNFFNLLDKLYADLYNCIFDFEFYVLILRNVKHYLSLFSIYTHFIRCVRSCDKLSKSKYCIYCSSVRMSDYGCPSKFYDIGMDPSDYSGNFRNLIGHLSVDLDVQLDPIPYFGNSLRKCSNLCEQFDVYTRPGYLCVSFSSILVCMYINYVMEALMIMNYLCGMVDRRKAFSLISSWDHCQRSSPSRISNTP